MLYGAIVEETYYLPDGHYDYENAYVSEFVQIGDAEALKEWLLKNSDKKFKIIEFKEVKAVLKINLEVK